MKLTDAQRLIRLQKAREKRLKNISGATKKQSDNVKMDIAIAEAENLITDMVMIDRFMLTLKI